MSGLFVYFLARNAWVVKTHDMCADGPLLNTYGEYNRDIDMVFSTDMRMDNSSIINEV